MHIDKISLLIHNFSYIHMYIDKIKVNLIYL